jgi:hypothetical protein
VAVPNPLFIFVVSDVNTGYAIMDLLSGKNDAALAQITAQTAALEKQAASISAEPPAPKSA